MTIFYIEVSLRAERGNPKENNKKKRLLLFEKKIKIGYN